MIYTKEDLIQQFREIAQRNSGKNVPLDEVIAGWELLGQLEQVDSEVENPNLMILIQHLQEKTFPDHSDVSLSQWILKLLTERMFGHDGDLIAGLSDADKGVVLAFAAAMKTVTEEYRNSFLANR